MQNERRITLRGWPIWVPRSRNMGKSTNSRRSQIVALFGAAVLLFAPAAVVADMPQEHLLVLSSYESPSGVYHALLENSSTKVLEVRPTQVHHALDDYPIETWWMRVDPKVVEPGQWTHFYFATMRDDVDVRSLKAEFDISGEKLTLDIPSSRSELDITYAVHEPSSNIFYFYFRNNTDRPVSIHSIKANGIALTNLGPTTPVELAPGRKGLVLGHLDGLEVPIGGVLPAHMELATAEKVFHRFGYLFSGERSFVGEEDESRTLLWCPTHKHGTYKQAAEKIFQLADSMSVRPRLVHICRNDFLRGIRVFGQCVEQMRVNTQAVSFERGTTGWVRGLLDTNSECKSRSEPGTFAVTIEPVSIVPGSTLSDALGTRELREVVYAGVASGATGIHFRLWQYIESRHDAGRTAVAAELGTIAPYLTISEPVDLMASCSSDQVIAKTLLCGDRGIILIVMRKDIQESEPIGPFDVVLTLPDWLDVSEFLEVGGTRSKGRLASSSEGIRLTVNELDSAGVFILPSVLNRTSVTVSQGTL